jgi:hypothetical protein
MADKWLAAGDGSNRKLKKERVAQYERDIESGNFVPGDSNILISPAGIPLNGRHRLKAICNTKQTVVQMVISNYPEEWRIHLDQGAPRTAADYLHYEGVSKSGIVASGIRRYMALKDKNLALVNNTKSSVGRRYSVSTIVGTYNNHKAVFDAATALAAEIKPFVPLTGGSIIGLYSYLVIERHREEAKVRLFFDMLAGKSPASGSVEELRTILAQEAKAREKKHRPNALVQDLVIRAWNSYITGKPAGNLKYISSVPVGGTPIE